MSTFDECTIRAHQNWKNMPKTSDELKRKFRIGRKSQWDEFIKAQKYFLKLSEKNKKQKYQKIKTKYRNIKLKYSNEEVKARKRKEKKIKKYEEYKTMLFDFIRNFGCMIFFIFYVIGINFLQKKLDLYFLISYRIWGVFCSCNNKPLGRSRTEPYVILLTIDLARILFCNSYFWMALFSSTFAICFVCAKIYESLYFCESERFLLFSDEYHFFDLIFLTKVTYVLCFHLHICVENIIFFESPTLITLSAIFLIPRIFLNVNYFQINGYMHIFLWFFLLICALIHDNIFILIQTRILCLMICMQIFSKIFLHVYLEKLVHNCCKTEQKNYFAYIENQVHLDIKFLIEENLNIQDIHVCYIVTDFLKDRGMYEKDAKIFQNLCKKKRNSMFEFLKWLCFHRFRN